MSQDQPRRADQQSTHQDESAIKYGDVFAVSGELAGQPVAPQEAAMMQSAETAVLGRTQKGGPASVMQSAATHNERVGVVGHDDVSEVPREQGVSVTEIVVLGGRVVTEFVAGQAVGQVMETEETQSRVPEGAKITIGEALEAAAISAGDKPVEQSDAAAIQAAEARATGSNITVPGGIAAQAQSVADANDTVARDEDKAKLRDILSDATGRLPSDKAVDRDDAARVVGAEIRNKADMRTTPGGVAASVAAAARLNQDRQ